MKPNQNDISHIIKLFEAIYHELKESCPGHFSDYKLTCKLCEYSQYCKLESENETIQD